jgi:S1-C subfamily serine protease
MSLVFQCPSCGRRRKAPAELAGRKVRCVDCSYAFAIPAPGQNESFEPLGRNDGFDLTSMDLGAAAQHDPLADTALATLDSASMPAPRTAAAPAAAFDPSMTKILMASIGVAGAVLLLLAGLILSSIFSSDDSPSIANVAASAPAMPAAPALAAPPASAAPATPAVSDATPAPAIAAAPAAQSNQAAGAPAPFAATAAAASQAPATGHVAVSNERPPSGAWLNDLEEAKRIAAAEGKDILISFTGSDWCGWSMRMNSEVFARAEFRRLDDKFVRLRIDFPRRPENLAKIQNPSRNQAVANHYGVAGYPTVVLTDAQGFPYGIGHYPEGGVQGFLQQVEQFREVRQARDEALSRIAAAPHAEKLQSLRTALELLLENDLIFFYADRLKEWTQVALAHDPKNEHGVYELVFESRWMTQFAELEENDTEKMVQLTRALDNWTSKCKFQDGDRGGLLHFLAGVCLIRAGEEHQVDAIRHFQAGRDCQPENEELAQRLEALASLGEDQVAGSGFVVADGFVLTNHHVIEGPGGIAVQIEGKDPMPAEVVAQDPDRDIALLRVAPQRGVRWKPVSFADAARRGQEVAAFGYPLGNRSLILTRGSVSGQTEDEFVLLDCRVNPGNSGGPLCDGAGRVVGMVTAKSHSSETVDSYGLALPSAVIVDFLTQTLGGSPPKPSRGARSGDWEDVNNRIAPSVVMIVRNLGVTGDLKSAAPRRKSGPSSSASPRGQSPREASPAPAQATNPKSSGAPTQTPKPSAPAAPAQGANPGAQVAASADSRLSFQPLALSYTDLRGQRQQLRYFSGSFPLNNGMDVLWAERLGVFTVDAKGDLRQIWGHEHQNAYVKAVSYDGRYLWVSVNVQPKPPELWVLDPLTANTWQVTSDNGLPLTSGDTAVEQRTRAWVLASAVAEGKAIVAGWTGHLWLAQVTFDPGGRHQVEVFHEGKMPLPRYSNLHDGKNVHWAVGPEYVVTLSASEAGQGPQRLVSIGRESGLPPLVVDPSNLSVRALDQEWYRSDGEMGPSPGDLTDNAYYYAGAAAPKYDSIGLHRIGLPGAAPQLLVPNILEGRVVFDGENVNVVGKEWQRGKLGEGRLESLDKVPWHYQNHWAASPDEGVVRVERGTIQLHALGVSSHYGVLAYCSENAVEKAGPSAIVRVVFDGSGMTIHEALHGPGALVRSGG